MPGCQQNVDDIVNVVSEGALSLGELQYCALNILKVLSKSLSYNSLLGIVCTKVYASSPPKYGKDLFVRIGFSIFLLLL